MVNEYVVSTILLALDAGQLEKKQLNSGIENENSQSAPVRAMKY